MSDAERPEGASAELDPVIRERLTRTFEERIPFNRLLGLEVSELSLERAVLAWKMRPEQVGNFTLGILHGGVTSAALDAAGGLIATVQTFHRLRSRSAEQQAEALSKIGTIDLRVDFLRRGAGESFEASARILRAGSRVAVTRMELHNEKGRLLATGTGTYIVG